MSSPRIDPIIEVLDHLGPDLKSIRPDARGIPIGEWQRRANAKMMAEVADGIRTGKIKVNPPAVATLPEPLKFGEKKRKR